MPIGTVSNGEGGASVRGKINETIGKANLVDAIKTVTDGISTYSKTSLLGSTTLGQWQGTLGIADLEGRVQGIEGSPSRFGGFGSSQAKQKFVSANGVTLLELPLASEGGSGGTPSTANKALAAAKVLNDGKVRFYSGFGSEDKFLGRAGEPILTDFIDAAGAYYIAGMQKPSVTEVSTVIVSADLKVLLVAVDDVVLGIAMLSQSNGVGNRGYDAANGDASVPGGYVDMPSEPPYGDYVRMLGGGDYADIRLNGTPMGPPPNPNGPYGEYLFDPDLVTGLIPMRSRIGTYMSPNGKYVQGLTSTEPCCNALHRFALEKFGFHMMIAGASVGQGGAGISTIMNPDKQVQLNFRAGLASLREQCANPDNWSDGRPRRFWLAGWLWQQGESDTDNASYYANMLTLHTTVSGVVDDELEQALVPRAYMTAMSAFDEDSPSVPNAMLKLAQDHPDKFIYVAPVYGTGQYFVAAGGAQDSVHYDVYTKITLGELSAQAILKTEFSSEPAYLPTHIVSVTPSGNTLVMNYHTEEGEVVIDGGISVRAGTVLGFEWVQSSGTTPSIVSVTKTGPKQLTMALSGPRTGPGMIRYAMKGHSAAPGDNPDAATMPRGSVRDQGSQIGSYNKPLYHWAAHQEFAVGV